MMEKKDTNVENEQINPENESVNPVTNIADAQPETERLQKELLYLRADFENTRKRMIKEQDTSIKFANEKLIRELLTVIDLFDRGVTHGKTVKSKSADPEVGNFVSGMEMTQRELIQLLTRFGVEFIGNVGEKFDPSKHEAIAQIEAPAEQSENVLEVLSRGALLHGRLLAPAKVVVAKQSGE